MKILVSSCSPEVFAVAANLAHVEISIRLRALEVRPLVRAALATAMLSGGLFAPSRTTLLDRGWTRARV